jgi:hypothetical protein
VRALRLLGLLLLSLNLGTCTFSSGNLCPLECFEDDCCDPVCRPPPKKGSACTGSEPFCTYSAFSDVWATYACVDGEVQCNGTLAGCCPPTVPAGTCAPIGLHCHYDPIVCDCDGPTWHCFELGADLSVPADLAATD